ncbi:PEST proteolytic signal-containing nuclear protein-like isoform X2 [Ornithodoros turicata]|uniref:PEST proteolytic signal-containing nuclear protein-like isoform X2 n=1 Tax=Ornithodoros turicata TaxID=34597 RepID=UPI00313A0104
MCDCVCLDPGTGTTKVEPDSHSDASEKSPPTADKRKPDEDDDASQLKKQKVSMSFSRGTSGLKASQEKKSAAPISIKFGAQKVKEPAPTLKAASVTVAEAFNQSSDEEEEMPPEAKMRMRNIGRETPTSAGPNSFGKTRQGFCDIKKVFERELKSKMEELPK